MGGFLSPPRSWLRPHRGISQERLPLYLGFFEFVHNVRRRGKALLRFLIELLVTPRNPGWTSLDCEDTRELRARDDRRTGGRGLTSRR